MIYPSVKELGHKTGAGCEVEHLRPRPQIQALGDDREIEKVTEAGVMAGKAQRKPESIFTIVRLFRTSPSRRLTGREEAKWL